MEYPKFYKPLTLTVTGTNWTTTRAVGYVYSLANGVWMLHFNIQGEVSSAVTNVSLTIAGITCKSNFIQGISSAMCSAADWGSGQTLSWGFANGTTNVIHIGGSVGRRYFACSGDIELASKPTI